jgi:CHAT domain-containing protein/tetratricopeptide (TPR) repeat protein
MLPELINRLLAQTESSEQMAALGEAGLLNDDGLFDLLDSARQLARQDPVGARRLAELSATAAESVGTADIIPPAYYLQAQTHAMDGAFESALVLLDASRQAYEDLGSPVEALRTNVGLMSVLGELGRYREALGIAESTLAALETARREANGDPGTLEMLTAKVTQNMGTCHKHLGNYREALQAYSAAEAGFRALGMQDETAEVMMNRGIALVHLGRGNEARDLCAAAVEIFTSTDNRMRQAQALENLANVYLMLGDYNLCLDALEQAGQLLVGGASVEKFVLSSITADAYLALNLYPEAVVAYQEAEVGLRAAGMVYERAWTLWGLGAALAAQGIYREAADALAGAAALFEQLGNRHLLSAVMLEQAALLTARGQRGAAIQKARGALDMVSGRDWPVQRFYALLRLADLLMPAGLATAELLLGEAQRLLVELPLPHLRFRLYQRLGRLYRLQGRDGEAETVLETAVRETEQIRGTLAREAVRISFMRDKAIVYEDLIQLYLERGDEASLQKAFQVAEQAKSQALVDWLLGIVDTIGDADADPDLLARLRALRADLNAAYNELLGFDQEGERATLVTDVNQQVRKLENEIVLLRLSLAGRSPSNADPGFVENDLPLARLQRELPPEVTLVAYHILDQEVLAFVYQDGKLRMWRHLSTRTRVEQLLGQLAVEWHRFRAGAAFVQRHLARLERSTRHILGQLYDELVGPFAAQLAGSRPARLAVVPHGVLHQAPFHAFFDGERYLLERFLIGYAPSATVLLLCQQRNLRRHGTAVVVGVSDPLIPHVTREVLGVAGRVAGAELLLDDRATVAALQACVTDCRLLHLACHGLFRADNPNFSALKLADGWLTAADVAQMSFDNAFVALSACESGRSEALGGDEIIGMIRSFLGAGAAGLAVSLWLVEDETTAELMTSFYSHVEAATNVSRAAAGAAPSVGGVSEFRDPELGYSIALREAQLALKARHPHPYYWAPFVYVGRA